MANEEADFMQSCWPSDQIKQLICFFEETKQLIC